MNASRRFLYSIVGAAGCCMPAFVCAPSFGQAPSVPPSAPNTPSSAKAGGPTNNSSQNPRSTPAGTQASGSQPASAQTGRTQSGTPQAGPSNTTPATNPSGTVGPTAVRNAAADAGNAAAAQGRMGAISDDAGLAAWLIVDNEGEIAVSEIGRQKAQDPAVKQFAERMIQEHNQMLEKLRPIAANMNSASGGRRTDSVSTTGAAAAPVSADALGSAPPNGSNSGVAGAQSSVGNRAVPVPGGSVGTQSLSAGSPSVISLKRELGAQCLQSKQQELNSKQGADFDKCFMGMQVAMHMEVADTLRVFQKHATGQLRQSLDEALKTTEAHLEHAKQVHKTVEQQAQGSTKK